MERRDWGWCPFFLPYAATSAYGPSAAPTAFHVGGSSTPRRSNAWGKNACVVWYLCMGSGPAKSENSCYDESGSCYLARARTRTRFRQGLQRSSGQSVHHPGRMGIETQWCTAQNDPRQLNHNQLWPAGIRRRSCWTWWWIQLTPASSQSKDMRWRWTGSRWSLRFTGWDQFSYSVWKKRLCRRWGCQVVSRHPATSTTTR